MKYSPPIEEKRDCANPDCNKTFSGRKNKKFCNVRCKALHNIKNKCSFDTSGIADAHRLIYPEGYIIKGNPIVMEEADSINPSHYKGDIECIDAIKASMSKEAFMGNLKGNIIKYVWRDKENKIEDLDKAIWYINKLKEQL
jgi:hypothetical protein